MMSSIGYELNEVQRSLKKEKVIETLTEARLKILNQQICENLDEILAKRKLYMYMLGYYQDCYQKDIDPVFFSSLFDEEKTYHATKCQSTRTILRCISFFKSNISKLSIAVSLLVPHQDKIPLENILTFSTIPSIFGLLTTYSEQLLYLQFIKEISEENIAFSFARAIFRIPEFRIYIQAIADHISVQFCTIHGTALAEDFLRQFLDKAKFFIHLCPPIFSKIPSTKILEESFFKQLIGNPLYFGFIQIDESDSINEATSIVLSETAHRIDFIHELLLILQMSSNNSINNAYSEVYSNITAYQNVYYLTSGDINLINVLSSLAKLTDTISVVEDLPTEYSLHILQNTVLFSSSEEYDHLANEPKDPALKVAENSLRSLLINAEQMPMIESSNFKSFLRLNLIDQVPSYLSQQQNAYYNLLLSSRKDYKRNHGEQISLEEFVNKLIPNIQSLKNVTTLSNSKKLQIFTTSLTQMINSKQRIIDLVTESKFEVSFILLSYCFRSERPEAAQSNFNSKSGLLNYFTSIQNIWLNFAKQANFTAEIPKEMLLVSMFKLYTYKLMTLLDLDLKKWDDLYSKYTPDDNASNNKKLDDLFKNQKERFAQPISLIERAFKVQSILLAMKLISASFTSIKKLLNEVIGSFGIDELTSAIFYVVNEAKPENFISRTEYFYRVFQSVSEFNIYEYRDYVLNALYLHQTAVLFFQNMSPNPLQQDEFMSK